MDQGRRAIGLALLAALLFGVTTPAAKALLSVTDPWLLAGLLYIGSGIGLGAVRLDDDGRRARLSRSAASPVRSSMARRRHRLWSAGSDPCC